MKRDAGAAAEEDGQPVRNEGPRSVLRVVEILGALSKAPKGLGLARLSQELKAPKTSLLSLLRALESGHYLEHIDGAYVLGPKAIRLGQSINFANPFPKCTHPTMRWLAMASDETTILGVLSESRREVLYIETREAPHPLRFGVQPGDKLPLYLSGIGQILLAYSSKDFVDAYIEMETFERRTAHTLDRMELLERMQLIREQGFTVNAGGRLEGILGISFPIFDATGGIAAGIAVGAPIARLRAKQDQVIRLTRTAGEEISRILGYEGPYPRPYSPS